MKPDIVDAFRRVAPPDLLEGARTNDCGDLVLEVRAPADENRRLEVYVDVDLDEVIVAFGGGHSHGGAWRASQDPDHGFARSLGLVDAIREERIVGYRLASGGGGLVEAHALGGLPEGARVCSWHGHLDRDGTNG